VMDDFCGNNGTPENLQTPLRCGFLTWNLYLYDGAVCVVMEEENMSAI
jgi:hypothetical protein